MTMTLIISPQACYPNKSTTTISYVYCIQHRNLKSASTFIPSVVVPPELIESLRARQAPSTSANTQHLASHQQLIDLTLLNCVGCILMKQSICSCRLHAFLTCREVVVATQRQQSHALHNFQIRILSGHVMRVKPDAVPKDHQHLATLLAKLDMSDMYISTKCQTSQNRSR